ncbi:30S ribosomal protein S4 [Candidatus Woesearchaeota archaeon]|nr:30S ribosomal protein S4 [Candidatus Woesearchaeota archaeon]
MGDPRRIRKKFTMPSHMWQKARIDLERVLLDDYGLSNKREIWRANSLLRTFSKQAKRLIAFKNPQSEKESIQLLEKVMSLGLIKSRNLESVLDIGLKDVLDRRLQTIVFKKNLARSIKQARQMIVHSHVTVNDKKVTAPSYLVKTEEEGKIGFISKSPFSKSDHPERAAVEARHGKE